MILVLSITPISSSHKRVVVLCTLTYKEPEMDNKRSFESFGLWTGFCLRTIRKSVETAQGLAVGGAEVAEMRAANLGYKADDLEILAIDKLTEKVILGEVKNAKIKARVLSEEKGKAEINAAVAKPYGGKEVYIIVDPFDGSRLYQRHIPAFWYTAMAVYTLNGKPLASVVADINNETVDFADERTAFTGKLLPDGVLDVKQVHPNAVVNIYDAYLETYLMKPGFLYPTVPRFEPLFRQCKFILPNGGPAGWADVASGRVDIYLSVNEASIEVFTGMPIAQRAGAIVSRFDGSPVMFNNDMQMKYPVICCATRELHEKVQRVIQLI